MPANKSWHDYNESLVERGRVLIDVSFLKLVNDENKEDEIKARLEPRFSILIVI